MGFKQDDFKTCEQSGFCKRQRSFEPANLYKLENINWSNKILSADIVQDMNKDHWKLKVSILEEGTVRVKIGRPERYEIPKDYVLLKSNINAAGYYNENVISYNDIKVDIQQSPLKMTIKYKEKDILLLNENNLLNLENSDVASPEIFKGKEDTQPKGNQSIGMDITFVGSLNVFGIPEHASSLRLKPTKNSNEGYNEPYRLYNLDVFEYELDSPASLYGSIPFMLSQGDQSSGILWTNPSETWIDMEYKESNAVQTHWMSESGILDLFIFPGPNIRDVYKQYSTVIGTTILPPLFSLAYHQCRWNYNDQKDVETVDKNFDLFDIPYDVLWLDIEHTDGKRYLTWDKQKFPNPIEMQDKLSAKGRKDDGYFLSKEASSLSLFVKDKDLEDFEGWCWPGNSNWIDFLNQKAREFWKEKLSLENYHGSTKNLYIWNDMNEVSVFSGPEITMPKDNLHHEGVEHRDVHNIYGLLQQRSTAEGLSARNNERPFVLSRAFFAGSNRYGAIWTGDNMAEWSHLKASIPMLLSISLAGLPFAGADVGGFFGNTEPELLARWYQFGAFQPFFRAHAHIDTKRREPWLFGEPYTTIIRNAIRKRYKLLPYTYTLFYESHVTGMPVMRPLFFEYPNDNEIFQKEESFLLGSSILVQGVFNKGQEQVDVFLPGRDHKLYSGSHSLFYPLEKGIPVFIKGGSIIPIKDVVRRSSS
ncbi:hypothetical protein ROZALSC1DRAFT_31418, partial [Rozella allomycis CSF55]